MLKTNLGEKIRYLRKSNSLTQQRLADKADVDYSYLGAIERGEKNPTLETIEKIANGLEIEIYKLFFRVGGEEDSGRTDREINHIVNLCNIKTKQILHTIVKAIYKLEGEQDEFREENQDRKSGEIQRGISI